MRAASERTQSAPKEPTRAATGSTQALSHPKKVETPSVAARMRKTLGASSFRTVWVSSLYCLVPFTSPWGGRFRSGLGSGREARLAGGFFGGGRLLRGVSLRVGGLFP